jgi:two-component system, chemotaxis family, protein-glutamate methylesterase/glutaminase
MGKIRVLVVDDSVVIRRVVSEVLAEDPDIEVAGIAANGIIALAKMNQLAPDLVILDIEMPEMDGLETLAKLRQTHPKVPVIMFSSLTAVGAKATLDALALGATDYFAKPSGPGGVDESKRVIRTELIPAIKELCKHVTKPSAPTAAGANLSSARFPVLSGLDPIRRVDIVALAVSTGGPNALMELFQTLPGDLPVPIVMVQHMPPMFTKMLAERLTANSKVKVEEAKHGAIIEPGKAYLAPGDYHLTLARAGVNVITQLNQDAPENSCRPAADPLFRSVAKSFGGNTLAVILTGMGQDGLRGAQIIREAGGQILAQDEATSVVWGMPGAVVKAGLADKVLPLSLCGNEIVQRVMISRGTRTS